jgi:hypothetical protein
MEINYNNICNHRILPEDCYKCQTYQLLLINGRIGSIGRVDRSLQKDVIRAHIFKHLKVDQQAWIFNTSCFNIKTLVKQQAWIFNTERFNMKPLSHVYIGSFKAAVGFFIGVSAQFDLSCIEEEPLKTGYKKIDRELERNLKTLNSMEECIFKLCPERKIAVELIDKYGTPYYYALDDDEEFLAGYKNAENIKGEERGYSFCKLIYREDNLNEHMEHCYICENGTEDNEDLSPNGDKELGWAEVEKIELNVKSKSYYYKK